MVIMFYYIVLPAIVLHLTFFNVYWGRLKVLYHRYLGNTAVRL